MPELKHRGAPPRHQCEISGVSAPRVLPYNTRRTPSEAQSARMISPADPSQTLRGILLMIVAVFLFAIMDALIKWLGALYPVVQIVFFRSLFGLAVILIPLRQQGWKTLKAHNVRGHFWRTAFGFCSMVTFFAAFAIMPFADVYALAFTAPLFVTALSVPLLGESVGWRRWAAVLVGLAGVVIMIRPGGEGLGLGALLALIGAFSYAAAIIYIRRLSTTDSNASIVFYFGAAATVLSGLALPVFWVTPTWLDLGLLVLVGLIGGAAQIILTQAFRLAPVSVVTPFEYTAIIWAVLLGYLIWDERTDAWLWLGVVLVVASGLYILHRETVRSRTVRSVPAPGTGGRSEL